MGNQIVCVRCDGTGYLPELDLICMSCAGNGCLPEEAPSDWYWAIRDAAAITLLGAFLVWLTLWSAGIGFAVVLLLFVWWGLPLGALEGIWQDLIHWMRGGL